MVIEVLLSGESDRATTSWASLTLGEAFTNVTICFLVGHVLFASGTLELELVELLLLKFVERSSVERFVSAVRAGVVPFTLGLGTDMAEKCLAAAAF